MSPVPPNARAPGHGTAPARDAASARAAAPSRCAVPSRGGRPAPARLALFVLVLLPALAPIAAAPLWAQESAREAELSRVRGEIRRLEGELRRLSARESGAAGELERVTVELELQQGQVAEARAAREVAGERLRASEAELRRLGGELEAVRSELRRRVGGLYRLGRHGYLRLLLSVETGADPLEAVRTLRYLVRRDARAFARYSEARDRVGAERETLAAWRDESQLWLEREETRRRELERVQRRQELVLARLGGERRTLTEQAARLEDRESKLANFIDFLVGRSNGAPPGPLAGRPIQDFRGVLDWPAAGRVSQGFGPRLDPRYGTRVPHNGVELTLTAGTEVRAVYPGKVLFASPFQGYGPTVILHHPGRVFSLYAGLSRLSVGRDAVVDLGDVVGTSGETLYFEVRVENRPEDPTDWLR